MNVTVDDLYSEIGKLAMTLRKREEQVANYDAQVKELSTRIVALEAELATFTGTPDPVDGEGVADGR